MNNRIWLKIDTQLSRKANWLETFYMFVHPFFTGCREKQHGLILWVMLFHIIDDQPLICFFIREMLKDMNHETEVFNSSAGYLEYLESSEYRVPAAVISDITMPGQNGYQLMEQVLSRHPDSRFVLMSGGLDIRDEHKQESCVFLHKPFRQEDFKNAVFSVTPCYQGS